MIPVFVVNSARMDTKSLTEKLQKCLDDQKAVYAVVAIMGSTEHGACDPLGDIVAVREKVSLI